MQKFNLQDWVAAGGTIAAAVWSQDGRTDDGVGGGGVQIFGVVIQFHSRGRVSVVRQQSQTDLMNEEERGLMVQMCRSRCAAGDRDGAKSWA